MFDEQGKGADPLNAVRFTNSMCHRKKTTPPKFMRILPNKVALFLAVFLALTLIGELFEDIAIAPLRFAEASGFLLWERLRKTRGNQPNGAPEISIAPSTADIIVTNYHSSAAASSAALINTETNNSNFPTNLPNRFAFDDKEKEEDEGVKRGRPSLGPYVTSIGDHRTGVELLTIRNQDSFYDLNLVVLPATRRTTVKQSGRSVTTTVYSCLPLFDIQTMIFPVISNRTGQVEKQTKLPPKPYCGVLQMSSTVSSVPIQFIFPNGTVLRMPAPPSVLGVSCSTLMPCVLQSTDPQPGIEGGCLPPWPGADPVFDGKDAEVKGSIPSEREEAPDQEIVTKLSPIAIVLAAGNVKIFDPVSLVNKHARIRVTSKEQLVSTSEGNSGRGGLMEHNINVIFPDASSVQASADRQSLAASAIENETMAAAGSRSALFLPIPYALNNGRQAMICALALVDGEGSVQLYDTGRRDSSSSIGIVRLAELKPPKIGSEECRPHVSLALKPYPRPGTVISTVYASVISIVCASNGSGWLFDVLLSPNPKVTNNLAINALLVQQRLSGAFNLPSELVESYRAAAAARGAEPEVFVDVQITLIHPTHRSLQFTRLVENGEVILEPTYPDKYMTDEGAPSFAFVVAIAGSVHASNREYAADFVYNDGTNGLTDAVLDTVLSMQTFVSDVGYLTPMPIYDLKPDGIVSPFNYTLVDLAVGEPVTSVVNKGPAELSANGTLVANMSRIQNAIGWVVVESTPAVAEAAWDYRADLAIGPDFDPRFYYSPDLMYTPRVRDRVRNVSRDAVLSMADWLIRYGLVYSVVTTEYHLLLNCTDGGLAVTTRGLSIKNENGSEKAEAATGSSPSSRFPRIAGNSFVSGVIRLDDYAGTKRVTRLRDWITIALDEEAMFQRGLGTVVWFSDALLTTPLPTSPQPVTCVYSSTRASGRLASFMLIIPINATLNITRPTTTVTAPEVTNVTEATVLPFTLTEKNVIQFKPSLRERGLGDERDLSRITIGLLNATWSVRLGGARLNPYTQNYCMDNPLDKGRRVVTNMVPDRDLLLIIQSESQTRTADSSSSSAVVKEVLEWSTSLSANIVRGVISSTTQESFHLGRKLPNGGSPADGTVVAVNPAGTPMSYVCAEDTLFAYFNIVGNISWTVALRSLPGCEDCKCNSDAHTLIVSDDRRFVTLLLTSTVMNEASGFVIVDALSGQVYKLTTAKEIKSMTQRECTFDKTLPLKMEWMVERVDAFDDYTFLAMATLAYTRCFVVIALHEKDNSNMSKVVTKVIFQLGEWTTYSGEIRFTDTTMVVSGLPFDDEPLSGNNNHQQRVGAREFSPEAAADKRYRSDSVVNNRLVHSTIELVGGGTGSSRNKFRMKKSRVARQRSVFKSKRQRRKGFRTASGSKSSLIVNSAVTDSIIIYKISQITNQLNIPASAVGVAALFSAQNVLDSVTYARYLYVAHVKPLPKLEIREKDDAFLSQHSSGGNASSSRVIISVYEPEKSQSPLWSVTAGSIDDAHLALVGAFVLANRGQVCFAMESLVCFPYDTQPITEQSLRFYVTPPHPVPHLWVPATNIDGVMVFATPPYAVHALRFQKNSLRPDVAWGGVTWAGKRNTSSDRSSNNTDANDTDSSDFEVTMRIDPSTCESPRLSGEAALVICYAATSDKSIKGGEEDNAKSRGEASALLQDQHLYLIRADSGKVLLANGPWANDKFATFSDDGTMVTYVNNLQTAITIRLFGVEQRVPFNYNGLLCTTEGDASYLLAVNQFGSLLPGLQSRKTPFDPSEPVVQRSYEGQLYAYQRRTFDGTMLGETFAIVDSIFIIAPLQDALSPTVRDQGGLNFFLSDDISLMDDGYLMPIMDPGRCARCSSNCPTYCSVDLLTGNQYYNVVEMHHHLSYRKTKGHYYFGSTPYSFELHDYGGNLTAMVQRRIHDNRLFQQVIGCHNSTSEQSITRFADTNRYCLMVPRLQMKTWVVVEVADAAMFASVTVYNGDWAGGFFSAVPAWTLTPVYRVASNVALSATLSLARIAQAFPNTHADGAAYHEINSVSVSKDAISNISTLAVKTDAGVFALSDSACESTEEDIPRCPETSYTFLPERTDKRLRTVTWTGDPETNWGDGFITTDFVIKVQNLLRSPRTGKPEMCGVANTTCPTHCLPSSACPNLVKAMVMDFLYTMTWMPLGSIPAMLALEAASTCILRYLKKEAERRKERELNTTTLATTSTMTAMPTTVTESDSSSSSSSQTQPTVSFPSRFVHGAAADVDESIRSGARTALEVAAVFEDTACTQRNDDGDDHAPLLSVTKFEEEPAWLDLLTVVAENIEERKAKAVSAYESAQRLKNHISLLEAQSRRGNRPAAYQAPLQQTLTPSEEKAHYRILTEAAQQLFSQNNAIDDSLASFLFGLSVAKTNTTSARNAPRAQLPPIPRSSSLSPLGLLGEEPADPTIFSYTIPPWLEPDTVTDVLRQFVFPKTWTVCTEDGSVLFVTKPASALSRTLGSATHEIILAEFKADGSVDPNIKVAFRCTTCVFFILKGVIAAPAAWLVLGAIKSLIVVVVFYWMQERVKYRQWVRHEHTLRIKRHEKFLKDLGVRLRAHELVERHEEALAEQREKLEEAEAVAKHKLKLLQKQDALKNHSLVSSASGGSSGNVTGNGDQTTDGQLPPTQAMMMINKEAKPSNGGFVSSATMESQPSASILSFYEHLTYDAQELIRRSIRNSSFQFIPYADGLGVLRKRRQSCESLNYSDENDDEEEQELNTEEKLNYVQRPFAASIIGDPRVSQLAKDRPNFEEYIVTPAMKESALEISELSREERTEEKRELRFALDQTRLSLRHEREAFEKSEASRSWITRLLPNPMACFGSVLSGLAMFRRGAPRRQMAMRIRDNFLTKNFDKKSLVEMLVAVLGADPDDEGTLERVKAFAHFYQWNLCDNRQWVVREYVNEWETTADEVITAMEVELEGVHARLRTVYALFVIVFEEEMGYVRSTQSPDLIRLRPKAQMSDGNLPEEIDSRSDRDALEETEDDPTNEHQSTLLKSDSYVPPGDKARKSRKSRQALMGKASSLGLGLMKPGAKKQYMSSPSFTGRQDAEGRPVMTRGVGATSSRRFLSMMIDNEDPAAVVQAERSEKLSLELQLVEQRLARQVEERRKEEKQERAREKARRAEQSARASVNKIGLLNEEEPTDLDESINNQIKEKTDGGIVEIDKMTQMDREQRPRSASGRPIFISIDSSDTSSSKVKNLATMISANREDRVREYLNTFQGMDGLTRTSDEQSTSFAVSSRGRLLSVVTLSASPFGSRRTFGNSNQQNNTCEDREVFLSSLSSMRRGTLGSNGNMYDADANEFSDERGQLRRSGSTSSLKRTRDLRQKIANSKAAAAESAQKAKPAMDLYQEPSPSRMEKKGISLSDIVTGKMTTEDKQSFIRGQVIEAFQKEHIIAGAKDLMSDAGSTTGSIQMSSVRGMRRVDSRGSIRSPVDTQVTTNDPSAVVKPPETLPILEESGTFSRKSSSMRSTTAPHESPTAIDKDKDAHDARPTSPVETDGDSSDHLQSFSERMSEARGLGIRGPTLRTVEALAELQAAVEDFSRLHEVKPQCFERASLPARKIDDTLQPSSILSLFSVMQAIVTILVYSFDVLVRSRSHDGTFQLSPFDVYQCIFFMVFNSSLPSSLIVNVVMHADLGRETRMSTWQSKVVDIVTQPFVLVSVLILSPPIVTHIVPGFFAYLWLTGPIVSVGIVLEWYLRTRFTVPSVPLIFARFATRVLILFAATVVFSLSFNYSVTFVWPQQEYYRTGSYGPSSYWGSIVKDYNVRSIDCMKEHIFDTVSNFLQMGFFFL